MTAASSKLAITNSRAAPSGFGLFLAKIGGLVAFWAVLWAVLAAGAAYDHRPVVKSLAAPAEVRPPSNNPRWLSMSTAIMSEGER